MSTTRARRTAALAGAALVAALLPLAGPATPAGAADPCTSEPPVDPLNPLDWGCDDVTPPGTVITAFAPQPNGAGWIRTDAVSIEFHEAVSDGDAGPWAFRCRLQGPGRSAGYQDCTSPFTATGLDDTGATPYTFSVYAVDTADAGYTYLGNPLLPGDEEDPAQPDDGSGSPATRTWQQDTIAPNTFVFGGPYEDLRPDWPMATSTTVRFSLASNEGGVRYSCTLNGTAVPCRDGSTALRSLTAGNKVFRVGATDPAGNADPSPVTKRFSVPRNLTSGSPAWRRVTGSGYFDGDVLQTTRRGARVSVPGRNVRELRLIAPSGPGMGKVSVRIGSGRTYTVNLAAAKARRFRVFEVRDPYQPTVSGPIVITVLSSGRTVQVDAVLARR